MPSILRLLLGTLARARTQFPAVVVTVPRQSGKITLLHTAAPEALYASFDDPAQRELAARDPRATSRRWSAAGATPTLAPPQGARPARPPGAAASPGFVVCDVAERTPLGDGIEALPWRAWSELLAGKLGLAR